MKPVISLIGLNAGQLVWMTYHAAESALATGAARVPTEAELHADDETKDQAPVEIVLKFENGALRVIGDWPERAILSERVLESTGALKSAGGIVHLNLSGRTATYRLVSGDRGQNIGVLVESGVEQPAVSASVDAKSESGADMTVSVDKRVADDAPWQELPASQVNDATVGDGEKPGDGDWRGLHWKRQIQAAEALAGRKVETVEDARAILEANEAN